MCRSISVISPLRRRATAKWRSKGEQKTILLIFSEQQVFVHIAKASECTFGQPSQYRGSWPGWSLSYMGLQKAAVCGSMITVSSPVSCH